MQRIGNEKQSFPRIHRAKSYQAIEELIRICCAEAERARQLGIGELSAQEEEWELLEPFRAA